ncbi:MULTISPECIES: carbohydrate ABC transporter permease [Microbacterium]|jgi:alpha-1,4-digalacturonate transport system permease protein|uniref:carbohydrate ABC transporter permease n=1 Tax=Microbacterium TaxID=33882 RepID=UPI000E74CF26|nr:MULTISPECIES: carbohydrate ABC transporter permease [Microbacterium]MDF2579651.1 araQ 10 [Microbacterium sp.]RKE64131.1 alpha-1,4-digalacturonate transport system permease protein [Microbacterium sp. AG238]WJM16252.1 carbohydrate ABC transporter permease [Microbacterium arborescens]
MVTTYAITVPDDKRTKRYERRRRTQGRIRKSILPTTMLWVLAVLMLFPLLWFLLSSFKPGSELFSYPLSFFPREWTLDGYAAALERIDFARYFLNTAIVATVTTVLTVALCAMTGYALAKYKNPWLSVLGLCILSMTMLPGEVILNPLFIVIRDLGLYNSLAGVIIPSIITPTGVFMFRQFFITIPDELMQAARIDGASEFGIFFRIMMPLARPIALTLAIMSFQWRWNDYIFPLIILGNPDQFTLQIALRALVGAENIEWTILLSASVLSMLPLIALYLVFQRYITSSNINAGLKD